MKSIPDYTVGLLLAAKRVAMPPRGSSAQDLDASLTALAEAVAAFEAQMPVVRGVVQIERTCGPGGG